MKIIIDANLLCVIVAGYCCPEAIGRHKRLKAYTFEDFGRLKDIIQPFERVVTCAHVLTEVSNLLSSTNENEKKILLDGLRVMLTEMEELGFPSLEACRHDDYLRLGLTDAVLLSMEITGASLLTSDLHLALTAQRTGRETLNYNWLR